jgi:hypothetical protein
MVRLLLEHGADPNLPEEASPRGHALWDAVYHGYRELARILVEHGAGPNAMVESSGTPMMQARKDPELFQLLLAHGGDDRPSPQDQLGRLIDDGDLAGVDALLTQYPELARDSTAYWSEGILSGPANGGTREMLELLMRHGATVPRITKWGPAYYFKRYEIAAFLLEQREVWLVFERVPHERLVQLPVRLNAGRAHRRALAGVERPRLDGRRVRRSCHYAAQGVYLLDQMSLADSTDGGVAAHLPQRLDGLRE